jgi:hypothetical protein
MGNFRSFEEASKSISCSPIEVLLMRKAINFLKSIFKYQEKFLDYFALVKGFLNAQNCYFRAPFLPSFDLSVSSHLSKAI